ncbi:MAG: RraA family protein [Burkholderiales bacterium]|nr:RraA family protein [Burkholderiales bacterium]
MTNPTSFSWSGDAELFTLMRQHLFPAVVGDVLDTLGQRRQFLPQPIKPVEPSMVLLGRAMTVLEADYLGGSDRTDLSAKPFGLMFEALDDLGAGEVYVATGSSLRYALWGGLMSTRAAALGAAGALLDGYHRDTGEILERRFPTFSRGSYAQDQGVRGKVLDWRVPIEIDGVRIEPGDLLFGDRDGVLVIPRAVETEAVARALEKASTENRVRAAIEAGMSTVEAFARFGVM